VTNTKPIDIYKKLVAEYAPDLLPVEEEEPDTLLLDGGFDLLDALMWDEPNTLTPGLFYHDGIVFMTFPFSRQTTKKVGRGKEAQTVPTVERITICVTSNRDAFEFEEQTVLKKGFLWPQTFMQSADDANWNRPDIKAFLEGNTEPPDPWDLYMDIRKVFEKYVEYAEDRHYDLMTLYVMLSYVFRLFEAVGYIHFMGTHGAGKSTNLSILRALAFNPHWQSSMSASSLFRTFASNIGTMLFDEAESWDTENGRDLMSMIKAGYQEGSQVKRAEKNSQDRWVPMNFPAYSPKVFSSIAPQDIVLQSRCIVVNMRPAIRPIPEFHYRAPEWAALRNRLYLWAMHHTANLEPVVKEWSETKRYEKAPGIQNRNWQIAGPLLSLADYIGGDNLTTPMIEWLSSYWEQTIRNQNVVDRMALLLRCLPRVMAQQSYIDEHYYPVKIIHQTVTDYLDEDVRDQYKTRSVLRHLQTLGFTNKRNSRQGVQVQILEADVRTAITQRRIDPFDEDVEWLNGDQQLQHAPPAALATLWTAQEQTDDDKSLNPWLESGQ